MSTAQPPTSLTPTRGPTASGPALASAPGSRAAARAVEFVVVLALCGVLFFPFLGRNKFIMTESLRALVAREMLERPGLSMPTIHHQPYLRKPPLYAWTVTLIARSAGGLTEYIARVPSAVFATLLVIVLYIAGERFIGAGAGLLASVFALANGVVLDYGVRAELDMAFSALTTAAIILAWAALRADHTNSRRFNAFWLAAYAMALIASLWKGPHALVFLWLTLGAWSALTADWNWLRRADHGIACLATLAFLAGWTLLLSRFAGGSQVGKTAGIELFARLVPYRFSDLVTLLIFPLILFGVTLPASVFLIPLVQESRGTGCWPRWVETLGWKARIRRTIEALAEAPFERFCWCWLIANSVFLAIAPSKAPRYMIPIFAPAILLATAWILRRRAAPGNRHMAGALGLFWRIAFGAAIGVALIALVAAILVMAKWSRLPDAVLVPGCGPLLFAALLGLPAGCIGLRYARQHNYRGVMFALLAIVVAAQGPWWWIGWPMRAAADDRAADVAAIERRLAAGEPVFVIGRKDYMEIAYYSPRDFHHVQSPAEALKLWPGPRIHFMAPKPDIAGLLPVGPQGFSVIEEFPEEGTPAVLVEGPAAAIAR